MAGPELDSRCCILALRERRVGDSTSSSRKLEFLSDTPVLNRPIAGRGSPSSSIPRNRGKQSRNCRSDGTSDLLDFLSDPGLEVETFHDKVLRAMRVQRSLAVSASHYSPLGGLLFQIRTTSKYRAQNLTSFEKHRAHPWFSTL